EVAALKRRNQRLLVNDPTARAIDDASTLLHLRKLGSADEIARLIGQRRVDGEEVDARQQFVEAVRGLDTKLGGGGRRKERIEADDFHVEASRAPSNIATDTAKTD